MITIAALSWAGRPWLIPSISITTVIVFHYTSLQWTPLAAFGEAEIARELLGLLWQVEAASIALVLMASLFAFENLTRRRPNIPLIEYANRSRLLPFMMLAASGLLAIPVALFLGPKPTASFTAGIVALLSLGLLPFFFWQTIKVVDPSWLRQQRLITIRNTTQDIVDEEAYERLALAELRSWAEEKGVKVEHRSLLSLPAVIEASSAGGRVTDIDLGILEGTLGNQQSHIVVITRLHEVVSPGGALILHQEGARPHLSRQAVILSKL